MLASRLQRRPLSLIRSGFHSWDIRFRFRRCTHLHLNCDDQVTKRYDFHGLYYCLMSPFMYPTLSLGTVQRAFCKARLISSNFSSLLVIARSLHSYGCHPYSEYSNLVVFPAPRSCGHSADGQESPSWRCCTSIFGVAWTIYGNLIMMVMVTPSTAE